VFYYKLLFSLITFCLKLNAIGLSGSLHILFKLRSAAQLKLAAPYLLAGIYMEVQNLASPGIIYPLFQQ